MIRNQTQLGEYCLRRLGAPVINIEIDDEQINDRITDTIQKFVQRHYDGVNEVIYKYTLSLKDAIRGHIVLPDEFVAIIQILNINTEASSIEILDNLEYHMMYDIVLHQGGFWTVTDYYINMSHLSLLDDFFSAKYAFHFNSITKQLLPRYVVPAYASGNLLENAIDITQSDWVANNATLTSNDAELSNGKIEGDTITSTGATVFGLEQTKTSEGYVRGKYTASVLIKQGTYTGNVNMIIEDGQGTVFGTETITPTSLWTKHTLEVVFDTTAAKDMVFKLETATAAGGAGETILIHEPSVHKNNYIIIHGYTSYDPVDFEQVWNNEWVKKYATAMIKQQWGTNIKKYQGIQLPGGVEINGQTIFDEATQDIERLDQEFSLTYELPVDFFWA